MPKDLGEEYQPLLVKEHKDGKRTKVCDWFQSAFTPEDPHNAPGLTAFLNECTFFPKFLLVLCQLLRFNLLLSNLKTTSREIRFKYFTFVRNIKNEGINSLFNIDSWMKEPCCWLHRCFHSQFWLGAVGCFGACYSRCQLAWLWHLRHHHHCCSDWMGTQTIWN